MGVNIALGTNTVDTCGNFDTSGNGGVEINELVCAVNNALTACPTPPEQCAHPEVTATATGSPPPTTPTPTATEPALPGDQVSGGCARPGPDGLVACAGTVVHAFRCDNRFTCATGPAGRTEVGNGEVTPDGQWSFHISPPVAPDVLLVFQANIEGATVFRVFGFGTVGETSGAYRSGIAVVPPMLSPTSEASVRILDDDYGRQGGLQNFTDDGISVVGMTVEAANANQSFSGSADQAAGQAMQTALRDDHVQDAVMQNKSGRLCEKTTWKAAASPFIVVRSVTVGAGDCPGGQQNVELTIEPGVEVRFGQDLHLQVRGTMIARGTKGNPIRFTSDRKPPQRGDWTGIDFTDSSRDGVAVNGDYQSGSAMEYTTIEFARPPLSGQGVVAFISAAPFVREVTVTNSSASRSFGIVYGEPSNEVGAGPASIKLQGVHVTSNDGNGIGVNVSGASTIEIDEATVTGNSGDGLFVQRGSAGDQTLTVRKGVFTDNGFSGIKVFRMSALIEDSKSSGNSVGLIYTPSSSFPTIPPILNGNSIQIHRSTVRDNTELGLSFDSFALVEMSDSLISGNGRGAISPFVTQGCALRQNCFVGNGPVLNSPTQAPVEVGFCDLELNTIFDRTLVRYRDSSTVMQNNLLARPIALETGMGQSPPTSTRATTIGEPLTQPRFRSSSATLRIPGISSGSSRRPSTTSPPARSPVRPTSAPAWVCRRELRKLQVGGAVPPAVVRWGARRTEVSLIGPEGTRSGVVGTTKG